MGLIQIKKGLTLPLSGEPQQIVHTGKSVKKVALLGDDYVNMKPQFAVSVGDYVKQGQLLFTDRKKPKIRYTSPGSGKVVEINRGSKRKFLSIVIELNGNNGVSFESYSDSQIQKMDRDRVLSQLLDSGLWAAIRSRPFGHIADPDSTPHSIFITAMDTQPLAPAMERILEGQEKLFKMGLQILSKLTEGRIFLCKEKGAEIPVADVDRLSVEEFTGPHPAGNAGTHIHFLDPVHRHKRVWVVHAQDVIAVGKLFVTGNYDVERIISLAGPEVKTPRLIKTRIGASVVDLTAGECKAGLRRMISGSVFHGHIAEGPTGYLGRYHHQISVLPEDESRVFFGWLDPGLNLFSVKNIVASRLLPRRKMDITTAVNGGKRSIVPIGSYEKVMPLDILPTYLLRALAVEDIDEAENLGCLELEEEDLALCTFVCPSKINHGENLRRMLTLIEKEGQ
jgi:Na+-transporting NADH:ubiquinone oxidoreductase subunit A